MDAGCIADGPRGHSAGWRKSATEDHRLYASSDRKHPGEASSWRRKADSWLPWVGGGGRMGETTRRPEVSFSGDDNILELDRGAGCNCSMNILKTSEWYILWYMS